jgi:hypothetical protein
MEIIDGIINSFRNEQVPDFFAEAILSDWDLIV